MFCKMKKCEKCGRLGIIKQCGDLKLYMLYREYVKELIEKDGFVPVESEYSVFEPCRDANGCWIDDCISYRIQCPECGRRYYLFADTYHGWFTFDKSNERL